MLRKSKNNQKCIFLCPVRIIVTAQANQTDTTGQHILQTFSFSSFCQIKLTSADLLFFLRPLADSNLSYTNKTFKNSDTNVVSVSVWIFCAFQ
jgi:hypothetical protein